MPDERKRPPSPPDVETTLEHTVPAVAALAAGATASARFALVVLDGPLQGQSFEVDAARQGPLLVGQGGVCAVQLPDRQASRRHAAFDLADRLLRVTDLGSTNGTLVNGVTVVEALLHGGELVRVGQTTLRVDRAPSSMVAVSPSAGFGRVVGGSVEMRRLYPLFERLAVETIPVVLEGETGTGKELLAESIHELGPRASGPFVVFDCTSVAPTLIESELFGHERGAFTGAVAARRGVFEQAHGGTLLVDEIGDLPPALQPKLLRALERSEVRRVGSERTLEVDVRVLCATRRNLDREVQAGRFRDDLFHRLAVASVELPPLRRRRGDVPLLAQVFAQQLRKGAGELPEALLRSWEDYAWPGNVRELRNAVMRRLALGDLAQLEGASRDAAPPSVASAGRAEDALDRILSMGHPFPEARRRAIEEFEQRFVERVLAEHGGNVTRAAAASGVARRQLQRVKGRAGGK